MDYILLILFCSFLCVSSILLFYNNQFINNTIILFIIVFIGCIIIYFPLSNSPDSKNYIRLFNNLNSLDDVFSVYHKNYLFSLIQFFCKIVGFDSHQHLKFISSLNIILSLSAIFIIFKESKSRVLILLCLVISSSYIFHCFNILRQGLLFSFYLFTFIFYLNGSKKCYLLSSCLLPLCHSLGILLFLFNFLLVYKKNFFFLFFTIAILFLGYNSSIIYGKIDQLTFNTYNNSLVYIKIFLHIIFLILLYPFIRRNSNHIIFLFSVCILLVFCQIMFITIPIISSRTNNFCSLLLILLSIVCFQYFKKNNRIIFSLIFPLFFVSYMFFCYSNNSVLNIFYE